MEKFIVSARKYRPQTFDTVVGQQHITTTLKNAIRTGHLAHAFLFCGPRGVGKTTCARILAKTINCEAQQPDGEACNECHSCRSFNEGTSLNIHELDAASNNSVEDIRALVEQVRFAPQAGKYKVYIIDEVHMLSSAAFNAFLKTLEEPPPYAIFILATTEKHKILPTILSRCQIFDFKRITLQDTVDHLQGIGIKEAFATDEAALQMIAQKSEGCMRDALSILDKIVSFTNGQVTYDNTIEHLNILDADYYFRLMDCMLAQDLAGALLLYDDINKKGFEGDAVLNGFAETIRNLLICKDDRVAGLLEVVDSFRQRYRDMARRTSAGYLISALNLLTEAEIAYKTARNKRLHVELALIKLCYLQQALELSATDGGLDKKKTADARPVAFKNINPIVARSVSGATPPASKPIPPPPPPPVAAGATLVIETAPTAAKPVAPPPPQPRPEPTPVATANTATTATAKPKLGSLAALRQKIEQTTGSQTEAVHVPLEQDRLQTGWDQFIAILESEKNPAAQSFKLAQLIIKDENSFEATATNNLQQKFLELERNRACGFLQKELHNRHLQFAVALIESDEPVDLSDLPLSSKQQYQKMIEQYPLVKELRERLRLDLDL
ncbi:DNA polymerase III subunit gamma/tau [Paracnuella aquatica]|uniref:DNA polymerase III subunit gamma/tau n=1 Tax=Paracnuella aquatica TaxID=2268757 RepID=UPI000DEFD36A|nr:DNA polymerase III subunit gamma/tau [Paracnuella aquatica]RPD47530.1 DNA polymerase III subunit gamma/tau [Paracnuella aquatica]